MGILEKINAIEEEINRTQKNKATEYHLGTLKAKLAKYRSQLIEGEKKSGGTSDGFDVRATGDARVCMIGFPSVGKSTLLNKLTSTESEVAAYAFTTLTVIPGKILYKGAKIQLLDTPGILENASEGRGRGKQVIAVARNSDMILMMLDAGKSERHKELLQKELEAVGIRLNQKPPDVYFRIKTGGGLLYTATCPVTTCNEHMVKMILQEYKIHNCELVIREDITVDQLIDVIEGNRVYLRCLYVYNKVDVLTIQQVDKLAHSPHSICISCQWDLNLDYLLEKIWEYLDLVRIYTKPRGRPPDFEDPLILPSNSTVEHVCASIHRSLVTNFKYAVVWGVSVKHNPQRVGLSHLLGDEDVIQIMTSSKK
eukprot:comp18982_c0_seq1/m.34937 comp18982_c0_seq1/g.34937  ORF comp18982_c0_seq1/g.34937 comp18982_c0_seq1/m.34937 type:complete len:368 (-) comp18982_c0_seq1:110-1213(-)